MEKSSEFLGINYDINIPKDLKSVSDHVDKPKTFAESGTGDERITNCKNRVFKNEFSPKYDGNPDVFKTNEKSAYRRTGISQLIDIINCGYIRPKDGKVAGGHRNEVFWSAGNVNLKIASKEPILEVPIDSVKDGQIGALPLEALSAVWIFNKENGERENKLDVLKNIRQSKGENEQVDVVELINKLK